MAYNKVRSKFTSLVDPLLALLGCEYESRHINKASKKTKRRGHIHYKRKGVEHDIVKILAHHNDIQNHGHSSHDKNSPRLLHPSVGLMLKEDIESVKLTFTDKGQNKSSMIYSPYIGLDLFTCTLKAITDSGLNAEEKCRAIVDTFILGSGEFVNNQLTEIHEDFKSLLSDNSKESENLLNDYLTVVKGVSAQNTERTSNWNDANTEIEATAEFILVKKLEQQLEKAKSALQKKEIEIRGKMVGVTNLRQSMYDNQETASYELQKLVNNILLIRDKIGFIPQESRGVVVVALTHFKEVFIQEDKAYLPYQLERLLFDNGLGKEVVLAGYENLDHYFY